MSVFINILCELESHCSIEVKYCLFLKDPPPKSYYPHLTLMFCLHNRNKGSNTKLTFLPSPVFFESFCYLPLRSLSIWHYPSTLVLIELSSCISLTVAALSVTGILIWRSIWVPLISELPVELSCSLVYLNEILLLLEVLRSIMFQGPQGSCCLCLALNISRLIN